MQKRSFTLIELLVVVAIIAVLAALLFPGLQSARVRAQATSCASNLRQMMLGIQTYSDDSDGFLPPHDPRWMPNGYSAVWPLPFVVNRYLQPTVGTVSNWATWRPWDQPWKVAGIFRCPGEPSGNRPVWDTSYANGQFGASGNHWWYGSHYKVPSKVFAQGTNLPASAGATFVDQYRSRSLSRAVQPAMHWLYGEGDIECWDTKLQQAYPPWNARIAPYRHKGVNWLYCDGHVEFWTWKGYTAYQYRREWAIGGTLWGPYDGIDNVPEAAYGP